MIKAARRIVRRVLLGEIDLPQQCTVAMRDPQSEVEVWLHGSGPGVNVTGNHVIACAAPSTIAIGLDRPWQPGTPLLLKFHQRGTPGVLLGQLGLESSSVVPTGGGNIQLLKVRVCRNYCVPKLRLWGYFLFQAWLRARNNTNGDVQMTARATAAMNVLFTCPRPVVLVSVPVGERGNIFPMNLMGPIGQGYFAFALNSRRLASPLVERAGRVALSSIPFDQAAVARRLGKNHLREFIDWDGLPFPTTRSKALGIPVPAFATRVREMEIEAVRQLGSHTFFVARIVHDEHRSDSEQFFMIHGLYQAWRQSLH